MNLAHDWVRHHGVGRPDATALSSDDGGPSYTWGELERRVAGLAHTLRAEHGVRRGDRVVVIAENDPRVFVLQFALWRLGAVLAPLNWRLAPAELHTLCADADPRLVVHDPTWADTAADLAGAHASGRRLAWAGAGGGTDTADDGFEAACTVAAGVDPDDAGASAEDPAQLLYTSGTTGLPKGAVITRGGIVAQAVNLAHTSGVAEPGCHHFNPMPLFHAGGLNVMANPVLYWGGRVTSLARMTPARLLAVLGDPAHGVTHFAIFPAMMEQMLALPGFAAADFSALRMLVVAGGVAPPSLIGAWRDAGAPVQPQYGGTEMGPMALSLGVGDRDLALAGSAGKVAFHTEIRLVDAAGTDVGAGEVGEMWLRGPSIAAGYWRRPAGESFTDGWLRTGDAARRDAEGNHYVVGRTKEMYKSGGENVYPAEVEIALADAPGVSEIVVVGVPDPTWDEVGLAAVVPLPGAEVTLEGLRAFGAERIARFKLPRRLVVLAEFPRNVTGKVSRADLRDQHAAPPN